MNRRALTVEHLTVRFGGLVAVNDVSLHAPAGEITALIGPNGAGKSTTFNACTGIVTPSDGTIRFGNQDLAGRSSARRAQLGLGRTFQRIELFDSMTVAENVRMGPELRAAGRRPWSQFRATRGDLAGISERAATAMAACGIDELANRNAGALSTGHRRLVELARAIASDFEFLLLDEPSSGLDASETESFGRVLRNVSQQDGPGILLVEHDMALVRQSCGNCYVLEFGRLICQGPTSEVLSSEAVRSAYLGSEAA